MRRAPNGTFAITAGGVWTYTLDNALANGLAQGSSDTETFTATVTDDNGATAEETVTITITGRNDAPVVTTEPGENLGTVVEAGNLDDGHPGGGHVDRRWHAEQHRRGCPARPAAWSGNATGNYGTFAITAGGAWTYTLSNGSPTDNLAEGITATDSFVATVTDDFGATAQQTVTVTITGTNDSPVVTTAAGEDAGTVAESGGPERHRRSGPGAASWSPRRCWMRRWRRR